MYVKARHCTKLQSKNKPKLNNLPLFNKIELLEITDKN